ncbi:MAG: hypothetical protein P1U58_08640 [Verrucomicrobiales bacterium]|nr:hypothetical protein [Verrucomicrobiales bacterium]
MKKLLTVVLAVCFVIPLVANDPEEMTTNFENGSGRWKGDGRVREDETGNHAYVLKKRGPNIEVATFEVEFPDSSAYEIHYRVRAMPDGSGIEMRRGVRKPNGSGGFSDLKLEPNGEWVQTKFNARGGESKNDLERTIRLIFHRGEGEIQIDDIKIQKVP